MKIAVYGASGYQGKLVVAELLRRDVEAVLVGRRGQRLREAADQLGATEAELRVAALDDVAELARTLEDCDVVINCAAPFTALAETVVGAAIAARCHYVDTSGEQLSVKQTFDTFHGPATQAGLRVVPAVNNGGFAADLLAHLVVERVRSADELITAHRVRQERFSRGSMRSALGTVELLKSGGISYEEGSWRSVASTSRTSFTFPGSAEAAPVVRLAGSEVVTIPRHLDIQRVEAVADAAWLAAIDAVTAELIESAPEGPTEEQREAGTFTVVVDAVDQGQSRARGVVEGNDSYGATAAIAVEAAVQLAGSDAPAGVLSPAQAYDPSSFLDLMAPHGMQWSVEVFDEQPARA